MLAGSSTPLEIALAHVRHPEIVAVMECESGLQQFRDDGSLMLGQAGEIGIAQFKPATWKWMNEMRGTDLDILNPLAQINMIDWAFGQGLADQWTCYKMIHHAER